MQSCHSSFLYLIPVVMLFGLGKTPALIATIIYAVAPLIRLTDLDVLRRDMNSSFFMAA